ncbi:MAG: hypothetical protein WCT44_01570 [Candidatus Paceibacterota bacterium]
MKKARTLLILGIWVAIIPYTGFPYSWKDILTTLSGLALAYFSYTIYKEHKIKELQDRPFDNFKENNFNDAVIEEEVVIEATEE